MNNKTWYQGMSRAEQYDAYWIMGNNPILSKLIEDHPVWSLLPIRYYNCGLWEYRECLKTGSLGRIRTADFDLIEIRKTAKICSSLAHFSQLLWEKSAEKILEEYPDIMDISFNHQEDDGVYPIDFKYNVDFIESEQKRIMRKMISEGFAIDEYISGNYTEVPGKNSDYFEFRKEFNYEGVVDYSYEELHCLFEKEKKRGDIIDCKKGSQFLIRRMRKVLQDL